MEQKHYELEREHGVINGIRSLYMILCRVVFFPVGKEWRIEEELWHIWVAFSRFLSIRFPPFLLSLFLVCIDVKWGDAGFYSYLVSLSYYLHDSVI